MSRKRKLLASAALAAAGVAALAVSAATASTKANISISIPGSTKSAAPTVVSVAKPPAGTTLGIVTPLHADPGQAAMDTANARIHATTGHRPMDLLAREGLTPLATVPAYQFADPTHRTVSFEALVHFRGSRYSVPPAFAGKPVAVAAVGVSTLSWK